MSDGKKNWSALWRIKVELKTEDAGFESPWAPDEFILSSLVGKLEEVVVSGKVDIVTYIYFNDTKSSGKNCHVFTFI